MHNVLCRSGSGVLVLTTGVAQPVLLCSWHLAVGVVMPRLPRGTATTAEVLHPLLWVNAEFIPVWDWWFGVPIDVPYGDMTCQGSSPPFTELNPTPPPMRHPSTVVAPITYEAPVRVSLGASTTPALTLPHEITPSRVVVVVRRVTESF